MSRLTFLCADVQFQLHLMVYFILFFFFTDLCLWLRQKLIEYMYIDLFLGFLVFPIVLDVYFLPILIFGLLWLYSKSWYQILLVIQICWGFFFGCYDDYFMSFAFLHKHQNKFLSWALKYSYMLFITRFQITLKCLSICYSSTSRSLPKSVLISYVCHNNIPQS